MTSDIFFPLCGTVEANLGTWILGQFCTPHLQDFLKSDLGLNGGGGGLLPVVDPLRRKSQAFLRLGRVERHPAEGWIKVQRSYGALPENAGQCPFSLIGNVHVERGRGGWVGCFRGALGGSREKRGKTRNYL